MTDGTKRRAVISADDVRVARRDGALTLHVPVNALVTPLAREEAARWGIDLVAGDATVRAAPTPHIATCDAEPDGDIERIVARVRTLVPDADAGQVREIARRVLARWQP